MADAPHSKCGGKPCRFKSDRRYQYCGCNASALHPFFIDTNDIASSISLHQFATDVYFEEIILDSVTKLVHLRIGETSYFYSAVTDFSLIRPHIPAAVYQFLC